MKSELIAEEKLKNLESSNLNFVSFDNTNMLSNIFPNIKDTKTTLIINPIYELYNSLKENDGIYFYMNCPLNNYIFFSPKQALQIIHNITHNDNSIIKLTKGTFCHHTIFCEFTTENKENSYMLYDEKDISNLVEWLCNILKIGGYDDAIEPLEQNVNFKINRIAKTTECSINNEVKGFTKCKKTDKFDFKKGKLISFARALDFDNETVERIIDALFPQE